MNKLKTIGIGGQAAAGKDSIANYLVSKLNKNPPERCIEPAKQWNGLRPTRQNIYLEDEWCRNAFAEAVKNVFEQTFQVDRDFIEYWKRQNNPPEGFLKPVRDCLITIGDGFRKMKANIWIDLAFRDQKQNQILADLRYINEANYIKDIGGITILLWRPKFENNIPNDSEQQLMPYVRKLAEYKIEGEIPKDLDIPFDLFVINNAEIEDLYNKADNIVMPYLIKQKFI